jgi:DNA-binding PadR family transcriptional regulator
MSRWLRSGLRRDLCAVIYALEDPTGQTVKTALEDHYGDRLAPRNVHGALEELETSGYVTRTADGLHDRYALTDAGEAGLLDHHEWVRDCITTGEEGSAMDDE